MIAPFIGLVFGLLWLSVGAGALPSPYDWIVGGVGGVLFLLVAIRLLRTRGGPATPFNGMIYAVAVVAEVAAIAVAQSWLHSHGLSRLLVPVVGIVVGLHFIGLWAAWQRRAFLALAGAMVAVNIAALALPLSLQGMLILSGLGSSAALLLAVAA